MDVTVIFVYDVISSATIRIENLYIYIEKMYCCTCINTQNVLKPCLVVLVSALCC